MKQKLWKEMLEYVRKGNGSYTAGFYKDTSFTGEKTLLGLRKENCLVKDELCDVRFTVTQQLSM